MDATQGPNFVHGGVEVFTGLWLIRQRVDVLKGALETELRQSVGGASAKRVSCRFLMETPHHFPPFFVIYFFIYCHSFYIMFIYLFTTIYFFNLNKFKMLNFYFDLSFIFKQFISLTLTA